MSTSSRAPRYDFLDGLRGIAIGMVFLAHSYRIFFPVDASQMTDFFFSLRRGVPLFFMLSAFTLTLATQRWRDKGDAGWLNFYIRRAFRILPLWVPFVFLNYFLTPNLTWRDAAANMTFVFGFLSWGPIKSFVPGGWSIFIEETFYWLFPVLFPLAIQRRRSIYLALALFVVSFVWSHMLGGSIGRFLHPEFVYYFSPYHFYAFGLGFLCYQIYLDGHEKRYMNVPVIRWGLDGVVLLLLICWPRLDQRISSMFLALMIISALDHRTMWGRLVRTRPMVLAGQACYSIYLVHPLVLNFLINNLRPMGYVIFTVVSALVTIAIGIASYTFFERPMIELGRRIVARRLASARC